MSRPVAYYHFLISPWSYLAIGRLNALIEHSEAIVDYLPIDVGRTFTDMGGTPPAKRHPSRQRFRLEELARWSDHLGVPMNLQPAHFPADQTSAARMVHAVAAGIGGPEGEAARPAAGRLSDAVLAAVWRDERDIADADTLVGLAEDCDLDGRALLSAADDERGAHPLRRDDARGRTSAACSAPRPGCSARSCSGARTVSTSSPARSASSTPRAEGPAPRRRRRESPRRRPDAAAPRNALDRGLGGAGDAGQRSREVLAYGARRDVSAVTAHRDAAVAQW